MARDDSMQDAGKPNGARRFLTGLDAWALVLGCAVGWGAFVMPGSTFLPLAGPVGSVVALVAGALVMLAIAACFAYVAGSGSDAGGAFGFVRRELGWDHAFLCAWTVGLAYVAIIWANATSVVLISRYLFGPVLQVGYCYNVAGYDVYLGEMAVTYAVLVAFGLLACLRGDRMRLVTTALALAMLVGVLACLVLVVSKGSHGADLLSPALSPQGNGVVGVLDMVALAPWAFIGFESVFHASEEFRFSPGRMLPALALGVGAGALVYVATTVMSLFATPAGYSNWWQYVGTIGTLEGIEALPVFRAVWQAAGQPGLALLGVTILAAISSSLLGLYRAVGRLTRNVAQQGILPAALAQDNRQGEPVRAILAIMGISLFVPLVGRAAIGWIVDVTSVSASIAYLYLCWCALAMARREGRRPMVVVAAVGVAAAVAFFVFPLVPNFWSFSALANESYLILAAWAMLGLLLFWVVFRRDQEARFGKSTIVWIVLLFLIFFASSMWVREVTNITTEAAVQRMQDYHTELHVLHNVPLSVDEAAQEAVFLSQETERIRQSLLDSSLLQMALIAFSLVIMFAIYRLMSRRQVELEARHLAAEEAGHAKTMFLSNVSHDLRTPMNAIVGYTALAQREELDLEQTRAYLRKISSASDYMVALVNDVLEMGRIESGRLELNLAPADIRRLVEDVRDLFVDQMATKGVTFVSDTAGVRDTGVLCDHNQLSSVVLNLLSNAFKFTPEGGTVRLTLAELDGAAEGCGRYELRVADTGIGMSEEFVEHLFEPFARESTATASGIQGTGLGMPITKSIVDKMGGTIEVRTAPGAGTEFVVRMDLALAPEAAGAAPGDAGGNEPAGAESLAGRRVLMAEDNEINAEIAVELLGELGLGVDVVENGREAVEAVAASEPGHYDAVLMDMQMPVMGGLEAARAIRSLPRPEHAGIPIVAITANAFAEDVAAAHAAGMDAHLSKPLDVDEVRTTLLALLPR